MTFKWAVLHLIIHFGEFDGLAEIVIFDIM